MDCHFEALWSLEQEYAGPAQGEDGGSWGQLWFMTPEKAI